MDGVPDLRPMEASRGDLASEFFVKVSETLLGAFTPRRSSDERREQCRGLGSRAHGRSSWDSTPFQSARSAAREDRSAERPAGVTA